MVLQFVEQAFCCYPWVLLHLFQDCPLCYWSDPNRTPILRQSSSSPEVSVDILSNRGLMHTQVFSNAFEAFKASLVSITLRSYQGCLHQGMVHTNQSEQYKGICTRWIYLQISAVNFHFSAAVFAADFQADSKKNFKSTAEKSTLQFTVCCLLVRLCLSIIVTQITHFISNQ